MLYEEMKLRPNGNVVRVYGVSPDGVAYTFDPVQFQKTNNGWSKTKLSKLVPLDYPLNSAEVCSKTKRNKAKQRLHLEEATWKSTDGQLWSHSDLEAAIAHELELMEDEKEKNEDVEEKI